MRAAGFCKGDARMITEVNTGMNIEMNTEMNKEMSVELPKEPDEKHKRLKKAMDEINGKFGEGAVMKASLMPKKPHNK